MWDGEAFASGGRGPLGSSCKSRIALSLPSCGLQQRFPDARPPPVSPAAPRATDRESRGATKGSDERRGRLLQSMVLEAACSCGVGLVSTGAVRPSGSGGSCSRALMEEECAWAASVW